MYINRSYKANKIRYFLFFFPPHGKTWKKPNNDAVNVTMRFPLLQEAACATLHMHVHLFRAFIAVSNFQVVFDTFVVIRVVP